MSDLWKGHWTKIYCYAQKNCFISYNLSICSKSTTKAEDFTYYSTFPSNMAVIIFSVLLPAWKGNLFTYHCYTSGKMKSKVKELLMLYSELSYTKVLIRHPPLRHNGSMVLKNPCSANFSSILILSGRKTKQQNHRLQGKQLFTFDLPYCSVQIWRCR